MSTTNTKVALAAVRDSLLSTDSWSEYEVHFSFGDSQATGNNTDTGYDSSLDDSSYRIVEMSQGNARSGYIVPPDGDLMPAVEPLQHDQAGSGDIGPLLPYLRRRMQLFPGIKKIFVVGAAVGGSALSTNNTGTSTHWEPGEAAYNGLVADVNAILAEYPEARPVSALVSLGTVDATAIAASQPTDSPRYDEKACLALFRSLFSSLRSDITEGSNLSFAIVGMPDWFVSGATRYTAIKDIHRQLAREDDKIVLIETSDLDRSDLIHFNADGYRKIGQRAAIQLASVVSVPYKAVRHRFRYDPYLGEWGDVWGRGATVVNPAFVRDSERGVVLNVSGTGFQTTARLDATSEYSISLKVKLTNTSGQRNLVAFKDPTETLGQTFNLASSFSSLLHQNATGTGNNFLALIPGNEFATGTWFTVGVTWKAGENATLYVDGASVGTVASQACPSIPGGERRVHFGGWDADDLTDNALNGQMDDIVIVDRKLSADGMARLHWG